MDLPIPLNSPSFRGREREYLLECIDSGWISAEGPFVRRFEEAWAARVGRRYGIAVSNGTMALENALVSAGIGRGDEVIIPAFTIISCAIAVLRAGAVPVLVDSDPYTWNIDPGAIEAKITARTRAVMAVHIYGLPCEMDAILALAAGYNLKVIEDAAQMHGQTYRGKPCGSFGDISTLSFYSNKFVSCGEGGMLLTDDGKTAARCRAYRNLCFGDKRRFVHESIGTNMRISNLQAAVGLAQLENLDATTQCKRRIGERYMDLLSSLPALQLPVRQTDYARNNYWAVGAVLTDEHPLDAQQLIERLAEKGIGARPFFWPMHEQPALLRLGILAPQSHPAAERLGRRGFYLPNFFEISDQQIEYIVNTLRDLLG